VNLPDVLRQVRQLEIRSRRLVQDVLAGEYSSVFKGRGVEFADVRPYLPGDDVRTIDWRVTARAGAPYVRRYTEERELTVLFLIDHSASDAFGTRRRTKAELATEVSAVRNNDRVGAILFSDRVEQFVAPAKGKRHVLRVIREMVSFEPRGTGTDLAAAFDFAMRILKRRAVVFVFSDWMAGDYDRALEMVARRHDTIGVHLVDERDVEMPNVGLVALRDPERGEWRWLDTGRGGAGRRPPAAHRRCRSDPAPHGRRLRRPIVRLLPAPRAPHAALTCAGTRRVSASPR
jgi:uncharacterized protein (DUF58 family)